MGFGFPWVLGSTSSPEIAPRRSAIVASPASSTGGSGFDLSFNLSALTRSHLSVSPLSQSHDLTLSFGEEKRKKEEMKNREEVERRIIRREEAVVDCCPPKRDKGRKKKRKRKKRKGKGIREKKREKLLKCPSTLILLFVNLLFNPHIKSSYILPLTLNSLFFNYINIIT
jgi:hypothetical protein